MQCPSCGEDAPHDDLDCPHCGEPLDEPTEAPGSASTSPIVIGLVVVLGLGAICILGGIAMAIAIPNLVKAQQAGNEAAAIGSLKQIAVMQSLFRQADKDQDGVQDYGDINDLTRAKLLDPILASGIKAGYLFEVHPSTTSPEFLWWATAKPVAPGTTGSRYFAIAQDGVLYYSQTAPIPLDPETCKPPATRLKSGDIVQVR